MFKPASVSSVTVLPNTQPTPGSKNSSQRHATPGNSIAEILRSPSCLGSSWNHINPTSRVLEFQQKRASNTWTHFTALFSSAQPSRQKTSIMWSLSFLLFLLLPRCSSAAPAINRTRLTSEGLQRAIKLPRLVGHAQKFGSLTILNGRHRFAGSRPHNAVLEYMKAVLDETGAYDTEYQAVPFPVRTPVLNFTLGGQQYPAFGIDHCPEARANGTLHILAGTGCDAVCNSYLAILID